MQDIDTLNPWSLASVSIQQRVNLPETSGIYFCLRKSAILYIGMSMNLRTRWTNSHHRMKDVSKYDSVTLAYLELNLAEPEIKKLETFFIDKFQPRFNNPAKILRVRKTADREKLAILTAQIKKNKEVITKGHRAIAASLLADCYRKALDLQRLHSAAVSIASLTTRLQECFEQKAQELESLIASDEDSDINKKVRISREDAAQVQHAAIASFEIACKLLIYTSQRRHEEAYRAAFDPIYQRLSEKMSLLLDTDYPGIIEDWHNWLTDLARETFPVDPDVEDILSSRPSIPSADPCGQP